MQQASPPEPESKTKSDSFVMRLANLHLPRTNIFRPVRTRLAVLERPPFSRDEMEPYLGLIGAFIIAGLAPMLVSIGVSASLLFLYQEGQWVGGIIISPLVEETMKTASIFVVGLFLFRVFPNRRYGAAMGVAAGWGYALAEDISYFTRSDSHPAAFYLLRLVHNPFGHPIYSAFAGIGVFVLLSRMQMGKRLPQAIVGLPLIFFGIGLVNHCLWNTIGQFGYLIWNYTYASLILGFIFVVFPFLFILRDFLGGHFNFDHFLEPLPETVSSQPPPPPSPPMDQTSFQTDERTRTRNIQPCQFQKERI